MLKIIIRILLALFVLHLAFPSEAQIPDKVKALNNLQTKLIPVQDSVILDSLSIDSSSFKIQGIEKTDYRLLPEASVLIWIHKPNQDSVQVSFRTLPFSFSAKKAHKSIDLVNENIASPIFSFSEEDLKIPKDFVEFNSIDYNGTYGRSLTIGNRQDASLNSSFNMQLNGYILDSVRIEAALSDNNLPFQPDGNTQRLQEFDKVYITFEKGGQKLTAGDYELQRPAGYFMNFNKRVQGLFYQGKFGKNGITNEIGLSGSVAKGEFARNIFDGTEGNQGPYKLTGNSGEQFFIVLAGSEKVYIDGILLERGQDRDYIIDYNMGEVTFMARRMITKDSRIQVEFEYQVRNYLNTLFYAYDELKIRDKWKFRLNAYSNQDSKNQTYNQDLDAQQKNFLRGIGDHIDQALYPEYRQDTLGDNKILYRITDTTVQGIHYDTIFVYSTQSDSTLYSVGFTNVGPNKGNYILSGANTNGRSYRWIAPIDGQPQGDYQPFTLLITPKKQQMFTLQSEYQIDKNKRVGVELGASNYAPNLFAETNKEKHWGFSGRGFYQGKRDLGKADSTGKRPWKMENELTYEWTQSNFKAISPFRNVEFNRDWNLNDSDAANINLPSDQILTFQTGIKQEKIGNFSYQFSWFHKGALFNATRHLANLNINRKTYRLGAIFNLTQSKDDQQSANFLRPSAFIEKDVPILGGLIVGAKWEQEHNEVRLSNEALSAASYGHNSYSVYIKNEADKTANFSLSYNLRNDVRPGLNDFEPLSKAHDIEAGFQLNKWKHQQITLTGTYRILTTSDTTLAQSVNGGHNILGRLQYNGLIKKGLLVPVTLFEIGSGQQQKQEFTYVKVPTGQGNFMWVDYNGDGVQQANEFEPAIYPDQQQYIRIMTPSNEYESVNFTRMTQSLMVRPQAIWKGKKAKNWQKFVGRFSNQLSYQVDKRTRAEGGAGGFNPFKNGVDQDDVLSNVMSLNNMLYFNQISSLWGLSYNYISRSNTALLTYGSEVDAQHRNIWEGRVVFFKSLTLQVRGESGTRQHRSAVEADGRTYFLNQFAIGPKLTWINQSRIRLTGSYKWERRENQEIFGGEKATIQSLELGLRLGFIKTGNVQATLTYSNIKYNGEDNTPLSFTILDALKNGKNWLWHLNWERNLSTGIQISLDYDGRKSPGTPIIHTGTMSIRALL